MRLLQPFWIKFWENLEQKRVYAARPILRAMVDKIDPSLYRDLDVRFPNSFSSFLFV